MNVLDQAVAVAHSDANHADNQRRFIEMEKKLDMNTALTTQLSLDTKELLEMWQDAGVFFKWLRRIGSALAQIGKIAAGITALYVGWRWWGSNK